MHLLDLLAEQRIAQAIEAGALDNLPGSGKPLPDEDLCMVAEEERAAYRILKNAGYIPPELEMHRETVGIALRLASDGCSDGERAVLEERLLRLRLALAERGRTTLCIPAEYAGKIAERLAAASTKAPQ